MKKRIIPLLALGSMLMIMLTGCGSSASNDLQAFEMKYKDKVLSINSDKVDDVFFDDGIDLTINDDNLVRCMTVTTPEVTTYQGITVGDKLEKMQSKFNYEIGTVDIYTVIIDTSGKELNPMEVDEADIKVTGMDSPCKDNTYLSYYLDDDEKIERIMICDAMYAQRMR